jgi:hypothetical protein
VKLDVKFDGCKSSIVMLDRQFLFCCYSEYHPGSLIINLQSGKAKNTAKMQTRRERPGTIVMRNMVYTFCGAVEGKATSICERFDRRAERWEVLPNALKSAQNLTLQYTNHSSIFQEEAAALSRPLILLLCTSQGFPSNPAKLNLWRLSLFRTFCMCSIFQPISGGTAKHKRRG